LCLQGREWNILRKLPSTKKMLSGKRSEGEGNKKYSRGKVDQKGGVLSMKQRVKKGTRTPFLNLISEERPFRKNRNEL